ncbi:MAG: YbbR-like domain-containing protein, partial [Oceanihabitans sp.]
SKINAVKTDSLIKSAVNKSISQDFELQKPFDNIKFTHQKVTVSAAIEKHTEGVLKIPVTIINKPEDVHIKYFPKAVNVSYYTSLKNFNNIQASDFKVTCDFSTVTEDTEFLTPKVVVKPNLAKYVKMNQKQIEFIITK